MQHVLCATVAVLVMTLSATPSPAQSLKGGRAAQEADNRAADREDLTRLGEGKSLAGGRKELKAFIDGGYLVRIRDTDAYWLDDLGGHDPGHEELYAYARPWVRDFLDKELGEAHRAFGIRFKITSLVRTEAYQKRICRARNRAAICGTDWWEQSLHLTGAAVDISKIGMSRKAKAWMRKRLLKLERQGKASVIEERGAFHVYVRKSYSKAAKKAKKPSKRKSKRRR